MNAAAAEPAASPAEEPGGRQLREITGTQEMRALTHPVRLALLEVLGLEGPMTATEAGERIGESPTTCSFHLRQLAKYGFVEEAGGGAGRKRPWKLVSRGMNFTGRGDAELSIAANALSNLLMQRWLERHEKWRSVEHLEPEWSEPTGTTQYVAYMTLEELAEVRRQINVVMDKFEDREEDPSKRPPGARPIESVLLVHPILDLHPTQG